jgi:poly-gamma-glutamate capsule biosynthesis protein CapA/YwtB (metallophosphatase superfamily)
MPAAYGTLLKAAGLSVLGLANNHIDDFGPAGRGSTVAALDRLGIGHTGPAGTVARRVVRGRTVEVIAFAPYPGLNDMRDLPRAQELVMRSTADLVVVSFHGGAEGAGAQHVPAGRETYYGEDRGAVRAFAHAVIDAGAALVVGHGPHVVRGMEVYRGRLIAYSLGTFASYGGINVRGAQAHLQDQREAQQRPCSPCCGNSRAWTSGRRRRAWEPTESCCRHRGDRDRRNWSHVWAWNASSLTPPDFNLPEAPSQLKTGS